MHLIAVVAAVVAGWVAVSIAVALVFGQAVRVANQRRPRTPHRQRSPQRRAALALERVVSLATGSIPMIRPRNAMSMATGAIPIIRLD